MPENFQGDVDRYCAGWGERVTWRKMLEKDKKRGKKTHPKHYLWPKESWNDVNWVLSPSGVILLRVSALTSGHNLLPRFLWELGKRGGRSKRNKGELPTTNQSRGEAKRREEQREGLLATWQTWGRGKGQTSLPETMGHFPFGGQEGACQGPGGQA